jgi:hypothetical protein
VKSLSAIGIWLLTALTALAEIPAARPLGSGPTGYAWSQPSSPPNIHPAVARIVAPGNGSISYGSGTLVYTDDQSGLVVTNWHVVNEATGPISVHFPDGFYSLGSVQQVDRDWDLAAISIRKPNAQPVRLANEPPRPGEMLTIAGYGAGSYRAASGRCTQYVAPGTTFPYEMVEVEVSARQGDSGGPIFNDKGELAGVLFGEGHGRTSGSYCGRVRWFLTSVVRETPRMPTIVAAAPMRPLPPRPTESRDEQEIQAVALAPSPFAQSRAGTMVHSTSSTDKGAAIAAVASSKTSPGEGNNLGWEDLAGETLGEQAKTVLAGIGLMMIILHGLRWLSRDEAQAKA